MTKHWFRRLTVRRWCYVIRIDNYMLAFPALTVPFLYLVIFRKIRYKGFWDCFSFVYGVDGNVFPEIPKLIRILYDILPQ